VVGVALSGGILAVPLKSLLAASSDRGPARCGRRCCRPGVQQIAQMPAALAVSVTGFYRSAIGVTFLVGGAIIGLAFLVVLFLPELPLKTATVKPAAQTA
jgi:hypothetical protein